MLAVAEAWRPYRTIAAMILWHAYIQKAYQTARDKNPALPDMF